MRQYLDLLRTIREHGARKTDRTGTGTLSAVNSSPDGNPDNGWRDLNEITNTRTQPVRMESDRQRTPSLEDEANKLKKRLEKSRYVAAPGFHRALELKEQARRNTGAVAQ